MDKETMIKLSNITCRLNSLVAVLCGYCDNFAEDAKEISDLTDFSRILKETINELYDLL